MVGQRRCTVSAPLSIKLVSTTICKIVMEMCVAVSPWSYAVHTRQWVHQQCIVKSPLLLSTHVLISLYYHHFCYGIIIILIIIVLKTITIFKYKITFWHKHDPQIYLINEFLEPSSATNSKYVYYPCHYILSFHIQNRNVEPRREEMQSSI